MAGLPWHLHFLVLTGYAASSTLQFVDVKAGLCCENGITYFLLPEMKKVA
jgi:hypothetical protein